MALTPNFTSSQNSGNPLLLTLQDTSTGSDVLITSRRVYLLKSDGTYLVPTGTTTNYIVWAYNLPSIDISVLTQDYALSIQVDWINVSGTVLYTKTVASGFTAYSETFYYNLTQGQVTIQSPNIALSTNYYQNKMLLRVLIDSGNQAISFASDIYSASICYDSASYLIANTKFNFN